MTSVTKGEKSKVPRGKENEDDDAPPSHRDSVISSPPSVQPCCRLPREPVQVPPTASTAAPSKFFPTSGTTSSGEEYSPKAASATDRKIVAPGNEIKVPKKLIDKSEDRHGSIGDDDTRIVPMVETPPVATAKFGGIPIVEKSSAVSSKDSTK